MDTHLIDLESVVNLFIRQGHSIGKQAYLDFYVGKISERVQEFYDQLDEEFKFLVTDNLTINGITYQSYQNIRDKLFERIEQLYSENDFCVVQVISSYALTGLYTFKKPTDFLETYEYHLRNNLTTKGEYYIAPMYNYLIARGKKFILDKTDQHFILGTPAEYRNFLKTDRL